MVPKPSCVVASRIVAAVMNGSALVGVIVCCPPPPIEKFEVWTPLIEFELRMNWRRLPWCRRPPATPSSLSASPRVLTIALKLNP